MIDCCVAVVINASDVSDARKIDWQRPAEEVPRPNPPRDLTNHGVFGLNAPDKKVGNTPSLSKRSVHVTSRLDCR